MKNGGKIEIMGSKENMVISYEIRHKIENGFSWILKSNTGETFQLIENGEFVLNGNINEFNLEKTTSLPAKYSLNQNYPNPFNPTTNIIYMIPENSYVSLNIYNLTGQKIITLNQGYLEPGAYMVQWDGLDRLGIPVSSGVYLYTLESKSFSIMKKMVIMK